MLLLLRRTAWNEGLPRRSSELAWSSITYAYLSDWAAINSSARELAEYHESVRIWLCEPKLGAMGARDRPPRSGDGRASWNGEVRELLRYNGPHFRHDRASRNLGIRGVV